MHQHLATALHALLDEGDGGWQMRQQAVTLIVPQGDVQVWAASQVTGHLKVDCALWGRKCIVDSGCLGRPCNGVPKSGNKTHGTAKSFSDGTGRVDCKACLPFKKFVPVSYHDKACCKAFVFFVLSFER